MMFLTADEAFKHLESFTNLEKAPNLTAREYRLDRMFSLLPLFDNPQNSFKSIHVAGSKGKGSTAAFIAGVLSANGIKTGLYCSPHVESYKERISLSGEFFDDGLYASTASEMMRVIEEKSAADGLPGGAPTTFELLTLLSFLVFRAAGCEWAVFETGLGGRLDATNVITPEASVLTFIELEHTEYLGNTIAEIAAEKAGIIKEGVPVFSAAQQPEAEAVFRTAAAQKNSEILLYHDIVKELATETSKAPGFAQDVRLGLRNGERIEFGLRQAGRYQAANAALAAGLLSELSGRSASLPAELNLTEGLSATALPGRMEVLHTGKDDIMVVLDGAHTRGSVEFAADTFLDLAGGGDATLLFGAVEGKDVAAMAGVLAGKFKETVISTPGTFKKSNPDEVFGVFDGAGIGCRLEKDPSRALELALSFGRPVLVTGSFYMVAEIRPLLR